MLVLSGKGGVGKSTTAVQLARALVRAGKTVSPQTPPPRAWTALHEAWCWWRWRGLAGAGARGRCDGAGRRMALWTLRARERERERVGDCVVLMWLCLCVSVFRCSVLVVSPESASRGAASLH